MRKLRKSILLPILLLIYLAGLSYFTLSEYLEKQNHLEYWGTISATIVIIVALHYVLRAREKKERYKRDKRNAGHRKTW